MAKGKTEVKLTDRERQILAFLVDGYANKETAELLNISSRTVEAHRNRIMLKLNLHDLPSLVKYGLKTGLTNIDTHRSHDQA